MITYGNVIILFTTLIKRAFADENGIFRMKYGIPFKFKDTTLTLRFLAKDEKGNYSIPHTITLTQK